MKLAEHTDNTMSSLATAARAMHCTAPRFVVYFTNTIMVKNTMLTLPQVRQVSWTLGGTMATRRL